MHVKNEAPRGGRFALGVIVAIAVVSVPGVVLARGSYPSAWEAAHPGSSSYTNAGCDNFCHANGDTSKYNAYGQAVRTAFISNGGDISAAIATVDGQNSDGDVTGSTNVAEANADSQPGWTYGPNNTIYDDGGNPTTGQLPPAGIAGFLDPVTLVTITDNAFTPSTVKPVLGGSVQWVRSGTGGSHNVVETHGIFRSGDPTTAAIYYNRIFSAGTFPYACEIHDTMTGKVQVKPKTGAAPTGLPFTLTWATAKTNTGTNFGVQYRIATGQWKTWFANTTAKKAVFGKGGAPITPVAGTSYGFRVRSSLGSTWSGWSPIVTFKA